MSASFYDLMKYAHTGLATADMTAFDKLRAQEMAGGGAIKTLTGVPPLTFKANGKPLISWSMLGNGEQSGTPSPDNIIMPEFCGKLVGTDWIIPITCAGQTVPIYLGQTQTVRRIKKLVLTGNEEGWKTFTISNNRFYYLPIEGSFAYYFAIFSNCFSASDEPGASRPDNSIRQTKDGDVGAVNIRCDAYSSLEIFKQFLSDQYSAGTPITIWYVLAEPETTIINEPLAKIGDYADELHSTDAAVTIPTAKGQNTLTVDTDLQPSEMTITYRG